MSKGIKYSAQHTGKGKYHLIPDGEQHAAYKELCNTTGTLLWTLSETIWLDNGKFYAVFLDMITPIPGYRLETEFCAKCLKAALKQQKDM